MDAALLSIAARIEKISKNYTHLNPVSTGFENLDIALNGGFANGNLYFLLGRPDVGKTAFITSLLANITRRNESACKIGVISLGITPEEFFTRILSNITDVSVKKIQCGNLETNEIATLSDNKFLQKLSNIHISSYGVENIDRLINMCKEFAWRHKAGIIFIEDLYNIDYKYSTCDEIGAVILALKKLAVELEIPIIISVKLEYYRGEDNNMPTLKDWKDALIIEQFSDVVMILHQAHSSVSITEESTSLKKCDAFINIVKNNAGKLNAITFKAFLHVQRFEDALLLKHNNFNANTSF